MHPRYFSTCSVRILLNRCALGHFMFISQLILACILSYIEKLCCYFVGIWGLWGLHVLWRLMLSINKHTCLSTFLLVKTVDLNVSEHHFFRALRKKWSFFFRISSINMTKSAVSLMENFIFLCSGDCNKTGYFHITDNKTYTSRFKCFWQDENLSIHF